MPHKGDKLSKLDFWIKVQGCLFKIRSQVHTICIFNGNGTQKSAKMHTYSTLEVIC